MANFRLIDSVENKIVKLTDRRLLQGILQGVVASVDFI